MTRCPHCHGTGQEFDGRAKPAPARRGPQRRMIPFGNEADAALRAHTLKVAPYLFVAPCPNTRKDPWTLAREHIAMHGPGSALVLPDGESIDDYRFPALPLFPPSDIAVATFAYGWSRDDCERLGHALIANGLDSVQVLGGDGCPMEFRK